MDDIDLVYIQKIRDIMGWNLPLDEKTEIICVLLQNALDFKEQAVRDKYMIPPDIGIEDEQNRDSSKERPDNTGI